MDVNIVFECIGYGASRAVSSRGFARNGSRVPARYILETTIDPVAYCIEAYQQQFPDSPVRLGRKARSMILERLQREAGVTRH